MVYEPYIRPVGWLYATDPTLFIEPEKSIDDKHPINHELLNWGVEIINNGM